MVRGYVGTYTNGDSKGIYTFELDQAAGAITNIKLAAELGNPTYLNISKDHRYLYAVAKQGDQGGVAVFAVNQESGELTPINTVVDAGSPPCHVSMDAEDRFVFCTNYHKGTVESYRIQADGSVSAPISTMKHVGQGPDPRQEKAHTHFAGITPDGKYIAVCELGCDLLLTYRVGEQGELTEASRLEIRPGSGPRHLAFHPTNPKFAYMMTEFSSEVIALSYEDGKFTILQYATTLPADFTENNQGSAIHLSSDGKFVYAGNRGHNSIAIFAVDAVTGTVTPVDRVSTEGDWPRDFAFDPSEQYLIASNQESSNLVLYARDAETGKLTVLKNDIQVPNPVCIKF